ncbi:MAG: 50S ribosomal protein L15e [Candidatus Aenigmatarchaeota archaeon]
MKAEAKVWKTPKENLGPLWKKKMISLRKEGTLIKLDKPSRPQRARSLGYKAKQGFIIVRVRVVKGRRKRPKAAGGRRPKTSGRYYPLDKSKQVVAEQKAARKYPNMEILNSYWIAEDGSHKWFECILIDPYHPSITKNKNTEWIVEPQHKGRAFRGKTSASKKSRGLRKKGRGSEKTRQAK